jgi:hypothetical protein
MLDITSLPLAKGNGKVYRSRRRYRSSRKHFRHGQRASVARALTGAHLHLNGVATSLKAAAFMSGSNPEYVKAAEVLLKTQNLTLLDRVVRGHIPLLDAAKQAKQVAIWLPPIAPRRAPTGLRPPR